MSSGRETELSKQTTALQRTAKEAQEERKERRTSKRELCLKLDTMEPNSSKSPDRIHRLYALLQSTGKGASRLDNKAKNFFNEHLKMSAE